MVRFLFYGKKGGGPLKIICSQPYITVKRTIEGNVQRIREKTEFLHLLEDKILSAIDQFPLESVHDVSFKQISSFTGFLYLHTNKGVYSYTVPDKPVQFMEEYHRLKK